MNENVLELKERKCNSLKDALALDKSQCESYLNQLPEWKIDAAGKLLWKEFLFTGYTDGMAFANKIALIADAEDHHPSLTVTWGKVLVELCTHSIKQLSENDFIVAAKIEAL